MGLCGRPTGKSDTLKGKNPISCPDLLFSSALTTVGAVTFLGGIQAHKQAASALIKRNDYNSTQHMHPFVFLNASAKYILHNINVSNEIDRLL